MSKIRCYVLVFIVSALAYSLNAQAAMNVSQLTTTGGHSILPYTTWLYDESAELTAAMLWDDRTLAWEHGPEALSLGYLRGVLWLRFTVTADTPSDVWLHINPSFLDYVTLYTRTPDGQVRTLISGDRIPMSQRPLAGRSTVFPLEVTPAGSELLLRVQTTSALAVTAELWRPDVFYGFQMNTNVFYGVVFGLVILAVLVSLLSGLWTRQSTFFIVAAYLFSFGWVIVSLNSFDLLYLFPEHPHFTDFTIGTASFAITGFLLLFVRSYLQLNTYTPWLARIFDVCMALAAIGFLTSAFGSYPRLAPYFMMFALIVLLLTIFTCILMLRAQPTRAILLLITFVPGMLAVMLQVLRNLGYLPVNFWTTHLWPMSAMLQVPFTVLVVLLKLREDEKSLQTERQITQDMRRFYNLMAHELRTPLAVLETALSNVQLQISNLQPDLKPRLQRARVAVARLNNLVDNALAENRLNQLNHPLQQEAIHLPTLLHDVESLALITDRHTLTVTSDCSQETLYGDSRWLVLALLNLVDNAIKYSPDGGAVTLQVREDDDVLRFFVQDEGIGVDPASEPFLFDRFFRAANAKAQSHISGLGIGLYLVAQVAALHGGAVFFERPERGSLFGFSISLTEPSTHTTESVA